MGDYSHCPIPPCTILDRTGPPSALSIRTSPTTHLVVLVLDKLDHYLFLGLDLQHLQHELDEDCWLENTSKSAAHLPCSHEIRSRLNCVALVRCSVRGIFTDSSSMALSTRASAVRPKQCSCAHSGRCKSRRAYQPFKHPFTMATASRGF